MSKTAAPAETRRAKPLSPDVLEVLHMLSALESQPRPQQSESASK